MHSKGYIISAKFLCFGLVLLIIGCSGEKEPQGLKDAFEGKFFIGAALDSTHASGGNPVADALIKKHFNSIVAENCMKSEIIQPEQGVFDFEESDQFVAFGEANNMFIIGHTLIWHSQVPPWLFIDKEGNNVSRDTLIARMEKHISTLVGRYKGRVHGWDVVNEAISDEGGLRNTKFLEIIGEDYIKLAFEFAHKADPDAELYYNDYSMVSPSKREDALKLISKLQNEGVQIDGVGLQAHYLLHYPDMSDVEESIESYAATGLKVMFTELDVSLLPWPFSQNTADVNSGVQSKRNDNPYVAGLPDSMAMVSTRIYTDLFRIFNKHSNKISRVTFWGVHDGSSWKNNWPIEGRTDYPLLFDRDYQPKETVDLIIDIGNGTEIETILELQTVLK